MSPTSLPPTIHIIDDEAPFRRSLLFLLESVGWQAVGHESAEAFLEAPPAFPAGGGCLVLDIRMPRISGLELQRRLKLADSPFPIIFMTGHGDVELAVQAMKDGAVDFLQKPFKDQLFLDTVERAVQLSLERHAASRRHQEARDCLARLSAREHEVARLLALGQTNKEVARQLGIS
ncbi:MAG: response regulator, partial [Proteobacteria bacterium]|nr:response regulator [Pseudomonadota bacterium]